MDEAQMSNVGYQLLGIHKLDDALEVFRQNTTDFPTSANEWDSYAGALMDKGDKSSAIKYYKSY